MASQLGQLKSQIDEISRQVTQTAGHIAAFQRTFGTQIGSVTQTIGGSAQRKDQEVINSLQEASVKVQRAVEALQLAGRVSANYSSGL